MRPYLAQGAAMALEDAWTLGELVGQAQGQVDDWPGLLQRMAGTRWQRNARVQARSARNGTIFHAQGALRGARNLAMWVMGEHLLDNPWLYEGRRHRWPDRCSGAQTAFTLASKPSWLWGL
ncbi:MAG: hypothetical protein R3E42_11070 [Burkholderiaceae bacterium]